MDIEVEVAIAVPIIFLTGILWYTWRSKGKGRRRKR